MQQPRRPSEPEPFPDPNEEVVRLPVPENDLAQRVGEMPVPKRRTPAARARQVDLHEESDQPADVKRPDEDVTWEEGGGTKRRETPLGWFALIGLVLLGLGVWALAELSQGEETLEERAGRVEEGWDEESKSRRKAEALLAQVEREARAYLAADTVAEKATFVRHRERVVPLMRSYYERHDLKPLRLEGISEFRPFAIEKRPFILIAATLEGGGVRRLSMEQMAGGGLKFDWESEVAYQPMSLAEYIEAKPVEPMDFRVYARADNFYNFEFSDPERYWALRLTERDGDGYLFGYVERGTEDERRLKEMIGTRSVVPRPVLLRVRFLPGSRAKRSVLVEELVSPRWIYAENPSAAAGVGAEPDAP